MAAITENDASGGLGSFKQNLLGILTGAVQTVGIPYLAKELNLTSTVSADGNERYAAAPAKPTAKEQVSTMIPIAIIGGIVIVGLVLLLRR